VRLGYPALAALGLLLVGDVPNQPPPETVPGTLLGSPLTIATSRRAQVRLGFVTTLRRLYAYAPSDR